MKSVLKALSLAVLCASPVAANAAQSMTIDKVQLYYAAWSDKAYEQSMGFAFDSFGIQYLHQSMTSWGEYIAMVDLMNLNQELPNDFDDTPMVTGRFVLHKNIGDTKANVWLNNALSASTALTGNNLYLGLSYDWQVGSVSLKPSIGYHHMFAMADVSAMVGFPAPNAKYVGSGGGVVSLTGYYPFSLLNQQLSVEFAFEGQFARPEGAQEIGMVGENGLAAIGKLNWNVTDAVAVSVEHRYFDNYSIALGGDAGGVMVGASYMF